MLKNTFQHIRGISDRTERRLWKLGVEDWADLREFLYANPSELKSRQARILKELDRSEQAYSEQDLSYFGDRLGSGLLYRIALDFPKKVGFLDIESTGLSLYYDQTTVVGAQVGHEYRSLIVDQEDSTRFCEFFANAGIIVTFNGTLFDLKFLAKDLPALPIPDVHIDLRYLCKSVDLSGGQKAIEEELGIQRDGHIASVVGERAPTLWHQYRCGDQKAIRTLITYNRADVLGMMSILDECVERKTSGTPVSVKRVERPIFSSFGSGRLTWAKSPQTQARHRIFVPKYAGRIGPLVSYADLARTIDQPNLRIVGIDLSGSARSATGWCVLSGNETKTQVLFKDLDIVKETFLVNPAVVSIDSPLSLPKGRIRVSDDDPGRDEYGIMRECERELKRRGVNVYPSLIPSMQSMTARGIELADTFRKLGIPVIESYPGAAQDILQIPRKRDGVGYLAQALADFGLSGDFLYAKKTHDELDAITSAFVGLFFWSGAFEALGNIDEEFLIVPDTGHDLTQWSERQVIGISGPIAAGKTTAAEHLRSAGFEYTRYSLVLEQLLKESGEDVNRESLQRFGQEINKNPGQRWLCKQVVGRARSVDRIVIDGLRWPEDSAFFREAFGPGFKHIHIRAGSGTREKRYLDKTGGSDTSFAAAAAHPVEANVERLELQADCMIVNEGTVGEFKARLDKDILGLP